MRFSSGKQNCICLERNPCCLLTVGLEVAGLTGCERCCSRW
ncbi:hypothetical protein NC652_014080 [Populus alba x Populus x berolinensis]|nr:hypothetical protein NC652_014080 [Populus alba x Populus x berolinensis]